MTTISDRVFSALSSLTDGRVYPDEAPDGALLPLIIYQSVGGGDSLYADNTIPETASSRMQITVWSTTRPGADALGEQVLPTLLASRKFEAVIPLMRPIGDKVTGVPVYGSRMDFSLKHVRN